MSKIRQRIGVETPSEHHSIIDTFISGEPPDSHEYGAYGAENHSRLLPVNTTVNVMWTHRKLWISLATCGNSFLSYTYKVVNDGDHTGFWGLNLSHSNFGVGDFEASMSKGPFFAEPNRLIARSKMDVSS